MITDADYIIWKKSPQSRRCLLVEVDYYDIDADATGTMYFSNFGYVTGVAESPASTPYRELIVNHPSIRYKKGEPNTVSEIELANGSGALDDWFKDYAWDGRAIRFYLGSPDWARADFRQIFNGVVKEAALSESAFILRIRDKKETFNNPLHKEQYTSGDSEGQLKPVSVGQCFNVQPVLTNGGTHRYQFHVRESFAVLDVKDNGISVAFTPLLSTGEFTLSAAPFGTITCDVKGDSVGSTHYALLGDVIQRLMIHGGLTAGEIDSASFAAFNAAYPVKIGKYITSRTIINSLISELLDNVGADYYFGIDGKARLWVQTPPTGVVKHKIVDYIPGSFNINNVEPPAWKLRMGVNRNYSVQTFNDLDDSLSESQKNILSKEFATILTASDAAIKDKYLLAAEPDLIESDLVNDAAAVAELGRQLAVKAVPRINFTLKTNNYEPQTSQLDLRLGDEVAILIGRLGFASATGSYRLKTLGELNWGVDPLGAYTLNPDGETSLAILTGVIDYPTLGYYELDFWK